MFHATAPPCIKPRREPIEPIGPIHIVLDVSSRVHTTLTGPSTCLAISTARATPSASSRRPNPPPIK